MPRSGAGHQTLTERAVVKAIDNIQAVAAGFVFTRGDRLAGHEQIVQAAGARKAGVIGGIQNRLRVLEQLLGVFLGQILQKSFGADPDPAAEQPLKMKLAQPHMGGDIAQQRVGR